jgi:hypothetical protein
MTAGRGDGVTTAVRYRRAPGDPLRRLDEAVEIRSRQLTMSPDEVAALGTAAARVRGAN